ncbi:hypothetical protein GGI19_000293 [Coemansia pectinata]|uniref:Uncharacterized protein n=1 Tax=Coemansia pectinata TaxID=1052879 RepID=A0A9W8H0F5_9FUNG|nr:hypothetical protein GGI19_000293 [Coemansia pectinata]
MQIKCTLSLLVAAMAGGLWGSSRAAGMEVDLEWDIGPGAKEITTAMSMLRFANNTAPPATEWVPLGWNYGTLSLQHRADSSSFIVMQLSPPTGLHQVLLGKLSDLSEVSYHPTGEGPSQVVLESKVDLDSSSPYYFKVEAHHDMLQNRTIYEGLYSIGNHWMYMGSLVLQHPNKRAASDSAKAGRANISESSESESKETESKREETKSKSEEVKSEGAKSDEANSDDIKTEETKIDDSNSEDAKSDGVKSKDDDSDKDQDDDAMSDKDDDDEKDDKIKNTADKARRRNEAKPSKSGQAESDSDSDSDNDSDGESKPPSSTTKPSPASSKLAKRQLESESSSQLNINSLRTTMQSAFSDFLKSGLKALKPGDKKQSVSRSKRVAVSAASKNKGLVGDDTLNLFKNGIDFPSFSVFPRLYSGVKRLEGGDPALVRAGVYKKFQLRDRLGETFFITQGRAFAYDGADSDVAVVRHYFLSSSYLVSIDGPHAAAGDDEKLKESSLSSASSSSSSPTDTESVSSTAETAVTETTILS